MSLNDDNMWLLDCEPRLVQLEAIRRSFLGYALYDGKDAKANKRILRDGVAEGWGHFMQMRLGKTPTLLNEYLLARQWLGYKRIVILSPQTYKKTWGLEFDKFNVDVPVHVLESNKAEHARQWLRKNPYGALIANYEALRSEGGFKALMEFAGPETIFGADESITLKGYNSIITQQAMLLSRECGLARVMSGKPLSQGPQDLWSQMRMIRMLNGYNYFAFKGKYCKMGGFQGKKVLGVKNEEELADLMDECSFKARRSDWMNHFEVQYSQIVVELSPKQRRMYDEMDQEFVTFLEEEGSEHVAVDQIITKLMKMQQISSGFIIDEDGKPHDLVDPKANPKARIVADMLENEIEGKTIVAVHYKHSIDILQQALAKYNPAVIRGRQKDVDEEKARFNGDPNCRVIIGQIQATKYGHTLVGTKNDPCVTTLMYENTFSLDDRSQIEERNQGADQRGPTNVVDFLCSPNDMRPITALIAKEDMAAMVLRFKRENGILPGA